MAPPLDQIMPLAKQFLLIPIDSARTDPCLWEHSERVMRSAELIARLPGVIERKPDRMVLAVAAIFHDAGWAVQFRQGELDRWQLLGRPTNDLQRELAAATIHEEVGHLLTAEMARRAGEAIRHCNRRDTAVLEATILAEAENLDEVGVMFMLRQFRQYQAEGRPLEQLLTGWARQQEYNYWEARIGDCFHFEATRDLARARLAAVDDFMSALARDQQGADLQQALDRAGVETSSAPR